MDGFEFVRLVEAELIKRGIPKSRFYKETGISSATFSQWRKRIYSPSSIAIRRIEQFLGMSFSISAQDTHQADAKENPAPQTGSEIKDKLIRDIIKKTKGMTDEQAARLIAYADGILDGSK